MVDTAATIDPGGPEKKRKKGGDGGGRRNPPSIDIVGAASPVIERPADYINADAVYSTGQGAISGYHYDREGTYRDQLAANELAQVKGPGQG
jgi:hypothetical protein